MNKLVCLLPLVAALAACGGDQSAAPTAAAPKTAPADQPAQPAAPRSASDLSAVTLDQVLAGDWRAPENKARDPYRHPKQTLEFFGVKSSDALIEITPGGGGWYTEVLAPLLKGAGTYSAAIAQDSASDYTRKNNEKYRAKLQEKPAQYDAVKLVEFDPKAPSFGAPASADVVLTFRNVHNWTEDGTAAPMFKGFFEVLKPGGTLGVVDHRATAGADFEKIKESGYLPQDYVIKLATDAGFKLVEQSEINANPKDTKDYEKGVWTLPPTLALKDKDREKYLAIGESDRMTLKFVKPKGDQIFDGGDKNAAKP